MESFGVEIITDIFNIKRRKLFLGNDWFHWVLVLFSVYFIFLFGWIGFALSIMWIENFGFYIIGKFVEVK